MRQEHSQKMVRTRSIRQVPGIQSKGQGTFAIQLESLLEQCDVCNTGVALFLKECSNLFIFYPEQPLQDIVKKVLKGYVL